MKTPGWTVPILLLAGCGSQEAEETVTPAPTPMTRPGDLATPIKDVPASSPLKQGGKPLVSRETSKPAAAPSTPVAAPPPDDYRAIGTEPFWAVTVRQGQASLERPSDETLRFPVERADDANAIRYVGDGFSMTVTPGPCSDGMSNAMWSDRVQLAFAGGTLKGCGGAREDMDAPPLEDD